jgi:MATE family multidrug resistance protein
MIEPGAGRGPSEAVAIPPPPEHAGPVMQPSPVSRATAGGGSVREVAALAAPAVVSLLSVTLMWTADTFFVGRVGTAEQGGVGFAGTVAWTILVFFVGVLNAVQIFVAQHVGARSLRGAGEMTWQGIYLGLAAAVPVMGLSFLAERLVTALRVDPAVAPHAAVYLQIRLLGAAGVFLANACENYLRGVGDTRSPMYVTFAANALNIVLDYLFIFGHYGCPRLGVAGAAWATIASGLLQGVALFVLFERRARREGHLARAIEPLRRGSFLRLLRVGTPVGLQWLLDMGSWTVFTLVVAQLGAVQAAAHQVAISVLHFSFMPGYAISIAATTLVGQYLGAGDRESALRAAQSALRLALSFMGAMGVVFLFFRHTFIAAFNPDPAVVALGATLLLFAALFQVFDATNMVLSGVLRGAGDTRYPMAATIVLSWALFVPLVWLFSLRLGYGAAGGWFAAVIWLAGLALVLRHRYVRRGWLERELVVGAEVGAALGSAAL